MIGGVAAWLFRRNIALQREDAIQQHWKDRIRQIELDRDRNVHKLSAEIERVKKTATQSGQSAAMADYESLTTKLEEQVAEREEVIGELRSEVQSLRPSWQRHGRRPGSASPVCCSNTSRKRPI